MLDLFTVNRLIDLWLGEETDSALDHASVAVMEIIGA